MRRCSAFAFFLLFAGVAQAQAPEAPAEGAPPPPPADAPPAPPAPPAEGAPTPATEPAAPTLGMPGAAEPYPAAAPPAPAAAPAAPPGPEPKMPPGAATPLKIESPLATMKIGVLIQPQFESVGSPIPDVDGMTNNLYVRRSRILIGGTLFKDVEYFIETDFADLLKLSNPADGTRNTNGLNIQDAYGTWKVAGDAFKIDFGYMLPPLSHNAVQGATTLFGWDYFANTFRHNAAFSPNGNPVGRDAGFQLRGLVADGLLEYRAGLFQGRRRPAPSTTEVAGQNFFRAAARLQVNFLDPEPGFFYWGSYLGTKRIFSVGASVDVQNSYKHFAGDAFLDMEAGPGVITAQVNVNHFDGDDFLWTAPAMAMTRVPTLPEQTTVSAEAGYTFYAARLSPIVRFETRSSDTQGLEETRFGGGLAYWAYMHNFNLKAFFTNIKPEDPAEAYNQINVQAQFYVF